MVRKPKLRPVRLRNVARALRESPNPGKFTMQRYFNCDSPACALGHYAAREDLQRAFYWDRTFKFPRTKNTDEIFDCDGHAVREHFGISLRDARKLFDTTGCKNAQTPTAAADYIEAFVKRRLAEQRAAKESRP